MIPKVIHYCWFGHGEKPELAKKCIESWKKFCPDFEIREWNEETYDVKCHPYAKFCADNKKWAFLSDYVRLDVVARFGGIYLDTDVEVVRSLEPLLKYPAFYGFENAQYVATGLGFGAEAGHPTVVAMRGAYDHLQNRDGTICVTGCPSGCYLCRRYHRKGRSAGWQGSRPCLHRSGQRRPEDRRQRLHRQRSGAECCRLCPVQGRDRRF